MRKGELMTSQPPIAVGIYVYSDKSIISAPLSVSHFVRQMRPYVACYLSTFLNTFVRWP